MSITTKWYCDGLVIHARVTGALTVPDLLAMSAQIKAMVESSDAPLVHLITDLSALTNYPSLGEAMRNIHVEERVGWSLIIGATESRMVKFITHVIASGLRLRFRHMATLAETLDFLQKMDASLPDLQQFRHKVAEIQEQV